MTTTTQHYRDGIADWIDSRNSVGRDCIESVIRTFVQRKGIGRHRFLERKSERTSFPAIYLTLGKGFSPISLWLIVRGDQLQVWFGIDYSSGGGWRVNEPLACLDMSDPQFFEHLAKRLCRFDVELPPFDPESSTHQDDSAVETDGEKSPTTDVERAGTLQRREHQKTFVKQM